MIIKIEPSPKLFKRYRATMDNGKTYDFGLHNGKTYIDHHNPVLRENYLKRHYANPTEKRLIDNLVPSPSLFSALLLWGKYKTIKENAEHLNALWEQKHRLQNNLGK